MCSVSGMYVPRIVTPLQGLFIVCIVWPRPPLALQPGLLYYALTGLECHLHYLFQAFAVAPARASVFRPFRAVYSFMPALHIYFYTPQKALKPPSTGTFTPVTKAAASEHNHTSVPTSSSGRPKRANGVWLMAAWPRAV
jgi:hypothetical protein